MSALVWDAIGEHYFETGVDHGVLYPLNAQGTYTPGVAWNGLTSVSESPEGAEATAIYADNIKYLNLFSVEEFKATVEALTYPDEFAECDGSAFVADGVSIGQQPRKTFGMCYRTRVGNDVADDQLGYKLHLIYGAKASPSEKQYQTVNDSPETTNFSWSIDTVPVPVLDENNVPMDYKPTSVLIVDSTKLTTQAQKAKLAELEAILFGGENTDPRLPLPGEVIRLIGTTAGNG